MNTKFLSGVVAASLLAVIVPGASAVLLSYEIGTNSSVSANTSASNAIAISNQLDANLPNVSFSLNDGDSFTFPFFDIWTEEVTARAGDVDPRPIEATLDFSDPTTQAVVTGTTFGIGLIDPVGMVSWIDPVLITLGDRVFSVDLNDASFNQGSNAAYNPGRANGATIYATITQISSVASVPDQGSTTMLLGLAFLALAFFYRRRIPA